MKYQQEFERGSEWIRDNVEPDKWVSLSATAEGFYIHGTGKDGVTLVSEHIYCSMEQCPICSGTLSTPPKYVALVKSPRT